MTPAWTTPADVRERLHRRWARGEFLTAWACDEPFGVVCVPLRGPTTAELSARFDDVRRWAQALLALEGDGVRVVTRPVGHRTIGANVLPCRVEVHRRDALWRLLGVERDVCRFAELRSATLDEFGPLAGWMNRNPRTVLAHAENWLKLVRTVRWIAAGHRGYLREIPVPGVDTKFIEQHRGLLAQLLDWVLPADLVARNYPAGQFERRYGFTVKPAYVRMRSLDAGRPLLPGVSELSIRVDEFAALAPDVRTVYIVENETTYLAFPRAPDAVVLFGSGFAVSGLASLEWLRERRVRYWGDIDTHGFVALDRVRALVPDTESLLMDRTTLLVHRDQWVREPVPATADLAHLTAAENALYRELVTGTHGPNVRLEQERVNYRCLQDAIQAPQPQHA